MADLEDEQRPWYSFRMSKLLLLLIIFAALIVIDLVFLPALGTKSYKTYPTQVAPAPAPGPPPR